MRKLQALFAALCLFATTLAFANDLREGRDYVVISPVQPAETAGKIEITEFFSYMCPHCAHFEPALAKWVKALPKDVSFRRVPVIFRPQWEPLAKLYYTLEALGELERLHVAVFSAVHSERLNLTTDAAVADWAARKGIDPRKFADVYSSFAVQSKAMRAKQQTASHGISGVPALVVGGKYRAPDNFPGEEDDLLRLADRLLAKARAEQGRK